MKIERIISVFEKNEDGKFFREINADVIDIELLRKLFMPFEDDSHFYRPYQIKQRQYNELVKYIDEIKSYSPTEYDLFIEAVELNE